MVYPSWFRSPVEQTRRGFEKEMILTVHSYQNRRRCDLGKEFACPGSGMWGVGGWNEASPIDIDMISQ